MCELAANSRRVVEQIDREFCRLTGLNSTDMVFLAVATAFQTARWVVIDYLTDFGSGADRDGRLDHDDKSIKDGERESTDSMIDKMSDLRGMRRGSDVIHCRTVREILVEPVPFDAIDGAAQFGLGLSGNNHREMTLGHDPILGWFFGTINILTDTTTIKNGRTFAMSRAPRLHFAKETVFTEALKAAYASCMADKRKLAAAIAKEAIHLESDFFSKAGLPIPVIPAVLPDLSSSLYKENYDALSLAKDMGIVAMQANAAILINIVIAQIHGYFFEEGKYPSREVFEVKTRKIILWSNAIAESSNVISVAIRSLLGDAGSWRHLDFGGLAVLLWRIIRDVDFMRKVCEEFISKEFKKKVDGNWEQRLWSIEEN
ncbi:MAG: hypothetical protein ILM98_01685 [Kiritimatiellae bacterium]|nr:hypothetical protein [Kiritimatiellia bacterium]